MTLDPLAEVGWGETLLGIASVDAIVWDGGGGERVGGCVLRRLGSSMKSDEM